MRRNLFTIANDYNRALPAPARWAHLAAAPFAAVNRWFAASPRRRWAAPLFWALLIILALLPLDGPLSTLARAVPLGGDFRKELEVLQQWGDLVSVALAAILICLLDPPRRRSVLDLIAAFALAAAAVLVLKMLIGRPRPWLADLYDPATFLGPFGAHPFVRDGSSGVWHAWEFWKPISSDLWSMPSSHTSAAVVLSVFLASAYPRIRLLAVAMVLIVAICRVLFGSHYPTDVVAGAAVGYVVSRQAVSGRWGQRLTGLLAR